MRFLFVVHKNEEKAEQNSVLFHRLTLKERGLRPNGYFPLMRQPHDCCFSGVKGAVDPIDEFHQLSDSSVPQGAFIIISAISHLDIACITTKIICAPAYTPICCACKSSSSISRQAPHLLPISAFSHRVFKSVIWFARIKSRTSPSVFFF